MAINRNSDTWINEQLAARSLEDNVQNRRTLRMEYYDLDPYAKEEAAARQTTAQTAATPGQQPAEGGVTAQTQEQELQDIESMIGGSSTGPFSGTAYVFPARKVNPTPENMRLAANDKSGRLHSTRTAGGLVAWFDGDQLINENGDIERGQYDVSGKDVMSEYMTLTDPVKRSEFFSTLRDYDFYGDQKPSALALSGRGLTSTDENAIQKFLNYSSGQGRTWRAVMPLLQGQVKSNTAGGGRAVSVVSTEDATRAFREESLRLLGRMPTKQEIRAAVGAIQARERSRGAGGAMDAPSLSTAAQEQARAAAPGEAAAQAAGQAMNQIFALLGGR